LAGGLLLFGAALLRSATCGLVLTDEAWFLQVSARLHSGEVLYRDVFFGVMPLSAYAARMLTSVFGVEILSVKALAALLYAGGVLVSCRIARQLGAPLTTRIYISVALFLYTSPGLLLPSVPYTFMSSLFFLCCLSAMLSWSEADAHEVDARETDAARQRRRGGLYLLAIAGACAGLSFASKQNVGFYALVASLVAVGFNYKNRDSTWTRSLQSSRVLRSFGVLIIAFSLTVGLSLLPVWLEGGLEKLLDYGFTNKVNYLRHAGRSYFEAFGEHLTIARIFKTAYGFFQSMIFLLPPLALASMLLACFRVRARERGRLLTALLFAVAAFAGAFPRVSFYHLSFALPVMLPGLWYAWRLLKPLRAVSTERLAHAGLVLLLGSGLALAFADTLRSTNRREYQRSAIPHFRGILLRRDEHSAIQSMMHTFVEHGATRDGKFFILSPRAGLYYLTSGLRNPTPFDYPLRTAFGRRGESEVIERISRGEIQSICTDLDTAPALYGQRPALIESYMRREMERVGVLVDCVLYRARR
jgi:hypothetical protein